MKKLLIILTTITLMLTASQDAFAHAQITLTSPLKNKVVKKLPDLVWIEFDGNLITLDNKGVNSLFVQDSKKRRVDDGASFVGGARISVKLKSGILPGKYLVSYRVVSEDGHPVSGSYYFTYQP